MRVLSGAATVFAAAVMLCLANLQARAEDKATFAFQGVDRHYVLHAAPNHAGPVPVVVALHGLNETIDALRGTWTMDAVADREGFDVLYVEALAGRWAYADSRPVNLPGDGGGLVDDVGFIAALLDKLAGDHVIDPAHAYLAGISNGALMAWTLACRAATRFAAVAPIISGMIEQQAEQCHPGRLDPLLVIAGTDDLTQFYDGAMGEGYRLLSIPETTEFWRRLRGCAHLHVSGIPPHEPRDPTSAVLVEWIDCRDPSPQRFLRIEGGGHSMPSFAPRTEREKFRHGGRSQTIETAEELWRFFREVDPGK